MAWPRTLARVPFPEDNSFSNEVKAVALGKESDGQPEGNVEA